MTRLIEVGRTLRRMAGISTYPYTLASDKLCFIFVHVPKTAGTSLRIALGEPERGRIHAPWWAYRDASSRRFAEYYKFSFVRDPLDRVMSGYKYLYSGGNLKDDLEISEFLKSYSSFDDFVLKGLSVNCGLLDHHMFRSQSSYICDWMLRVKVDFIGKIESIDQDFRIVASALDICENLPHVNISNKNDASVPSVSAEVKERIYNIYRNDYEVFEYFPQGSL